MTAVVDDLRRVPLFQGMTDRALGALAELAHQIELPDGAAMTREGDDGDRFFLLLDGRARLSRGGQEVKRLSAGDFFGEISLIERRTQTATVAAVGPVRAAVIDRADFDRLMDRFPSVRLGIVMALTERMRTDADARLG